MIAEGIRVNAHFVAGVHLHYHCAEAYRFAGGHGFRVIIEPIAAYDRSIIFLPYAAGRG